MWLCLKIRVPFPELQSHHRSSYGRSDILSHRYYIYDEMYLMYCCRHVKLCTWFIYTHINDSYNICVPIFLLKPRHLRDRQSRGTMTFRSVCSSSSVMLSMDATKSCSCRVGLVVMTHFWWILVHPSNLTFWTPKWRFGSDYFLFHFGLFFRFHVNFLVDSGTLQKTITYPPKGKFGKSLSSKRSRGNMWSFPGG